MTGDEKLLAAQLRVEEARAAQEDARTAWLTEMELVERWVVRHERAVTAFWCAAFALVVCATGCLVAWTVSVVAS